ncbi:MAG TPA: transglutaminase-like domain-containing protein [Planctomycetota bacterium]|nr:transglutaminase-like domain-containing protein [Planctomycetota bacterium]
MRRVFSVALLGFLLVASTRAEDPPKARKVKLVCTVEAADGQAAELWSAQPYEDEVQKATTRGGCAHGNAVSVRWEATVERKELHAPAAALASEATGLSEKEAADKKRELEPEKGNEPDEGFRELARGIARDEKRVVKVARAIYDYVLEHMKYEKPPGKGWGKGSVKWACDAGYGNCTDFHALFMNLCRVRGIPARFTMGFSLPADAKGKVEGYHCWCEFYVGGSGWVPVDCSEASKHPEKKDFYFGALDADRVALLRGRDLTLEPQQKAGPVGLYTVGYGERDGKPVAVTRELTFEDVK